jgi:lipid-A-disaccharide synthase
MRYYIIAGERSGDLHGGNLAKAIKRYDSQAEFRGFGGEHMAGEGVSLTVHYRDLAFMGFLEIVKNLHTISKFIKVCKADISQFKPDVIILIDYGGFNRQIAKFGKKNNIKVFYYITPKVWAWNQGRAIELKANVDRMFVILPFEKDFYKKYNWDVDYVGNPVLDAVKLHTPDSQFRQKYGIQESDPVIALLPGSRKQELERMTSVMAEVVSKFPNLKFAVAAVNNLDQKLYNSFVSLPNVVLVHEDTYNLLINSTAAIVTSGTATLETALFKVPQIVIYKASAITYSFVKLVIKVPFISLVNLIAGKEVIKELIQQKANVDNISKELKLITTDNQYRNNMLAEYESIYKMLDTGSASENAGLLMIKYLRG